MPVHAHGIAEAYEISFLAVERISGGSTRFSALQALV